MSPELKKRLYDYFWTIDGKPFNGAPKMSELAEKDYIDMSHTLAGFSIQWQELGRLIRVELIRVIKGLIR